MATDKEDKGRSKSQLFVQETAFVFSKLLMALVKYRHLTSDRPLQFTSFSSQYNMFTYHAMTVFCIVVLRSLLLPKSHRLTET